MSKGWKLVIIFIYLPNITLSMHKTLDHLRSRSSRSGIDDKWITHHMDRKWKWGPKENCTLLMKKINMREGPCKENCLSNVTCNAVMIHIPSFVDGPTCHNLKCEEPVKKPDLQAVDWRAFSLIEASKTTMATTTTTTATTTTFAFVTLTAVTASRLIHNTTQQATCAEGFKKLPDFIPGDASLKSIKSVGTSYSCSNHCRDDKKCCSYEWSPTTKVCELHTHCYPIPKTPPDTKDQTFCKLKNECGKGYQLSTGKLYKSGTVRVIGGVWLTEVCSDICDKNRKCCSYQWSPIDRKCVLNRLCSTHNSTSNDSNKQYTTSQQVVCIPGLMDGCEKGFTKLKGDLPGYGHVGSYSYVPTSNECAKLCLAHKADCCSYEWSPSKRICDLNEVCSPTSGTSVDEDSIFCRSDDFDGKNTGQPSHINQGIKSPSSSHCLICSGHLAYIQPVHNSCPTCPTFQKRHF